MRLVFDKPLARLLPTRRRYALARLIALVMFRSAAAQPAVDRVVYAIDPDHDALENYFLSLCAGVMAFVYTAALLPLEGYAAALTALIVAPIVTHAPLFTAAIFTGYSARRDFRSYQSIVHFAMFIALSLYVARLSSPARYVAWSFLALCAVNAVAALIMFFARGAVARMEAECGM